MKEYIDNIEEIRNIRANYEPMDIDYIDKMGEEKTITNAQEYDVLYYIVHLQKEIERLKNNWNELENYLNEDDWSSVNGEVAIKLIKNKIKELQGVDKE